MMCAACFMRRWDAVAFPRVCCARTGPGGGGADTAACGAPAPKRRRGGGGGCAAVAFPACPVHGVPTDVFCTADRTLLCVLCALSGEHRGHALIGGRDALERMGPVMGKSCRALRGAVSELDAALRALVRDCRREIEGGLPWACHSGTPRAVAVGDLWHISAALQDGVHRTEEAMRYAVSDAADPLLRYVVLGDIEYRTELVRGQTEQLVRMRLDCLAGRCQS